MAKGLVYMRPLKIAYVRATGPYKKASIAAWAPVIDWLDRSGQRKETGRGYGLAYDDPREVGPDNCRYDAAIELPLGFEGRLPREFAIKTLPGGAYIRERAIGDYATLGSAIQRARGDGIDQHGLTFDKKRPVIVIYLDDPRTVDVERLRADVCLPASVGAMRGEGKSAA